MSAAGTATPIREAASLGDFLRILRRRKLIVIQAMIIVPLISIFLAMRQPDMYQASAQVLISNQKTAVLTVAGVPDTSATQGTDRFIATETFLARSPEVATRVLAKVKIPGVTPGSLLSQSSVQAVSNADLLKFNVTDHNPEVAVKLVNAYAQVFTDYSTELDTEALRQARTQIRVQMQALVKQGQKLSALYNQLAGRELQLETIEVLSSRNTTFARAAFSAGHVSPQPKRDGMLGLVLGIVLGIALAFLRDALDTRIRTADEITERLGMPLLGRLIKPVSGPPRRFARLRGDSTAKRRSAETFELELVSAPLGTGAEAFRMLRASVELSNISLGARIIMVTSAVEQEGKTMTVSNLAFTMARAGKRVILVDLDLRRPSVERYFNLPSRPGFTDVVLGDATLDEALRPAVVRGQTDAVNPPGSLHVLPTGPLPPDPGEWVGSVIVADVLAQLAARADVVLIDTPPVLHVGDALALSTRVDAMIIVVRLPFARRGALTEISRLLAATKTPKLGYVLTGAGEEQGIEYSGYLPYAYATDQRYELVQ